ncbi:hypothetical protein D3C81_1779460 [compost metagenome]
MSGSQVTNALRKFKDREQFGIQVKTGKNKIGQWYGNVLNIGSLSTVEEYGAVSGTSYANIGNSWNESLDDYVNPSGKFKAKVIKDNSNVVRGLIFTQTTVTP